MNLPVSTDDHCVRCRKRLTVAHSPQGDTTYCPRCKLIHQIDQHHNKETK